MASHKGLTLTIVIPVYNEQDYIGACLDALAKQTEPANEVIVVDNGSTDQTADIVKKYKFARLLCESQRGIVFARDHGFNAASCDIVGRIDADTLLDSDWCAEVRGFFATSPKAAAVTGSCYFYDYPLKQLVHALHYIFYYSFQWLLTGTIMLWGANMAIRRSAWLDVRSSCDRIDRGHEDIDLSLALKDKGFDIKRRANLRAEVSMLRGDHSLRRLRRYLASWHTAYLIKNRSLAALPIALLEVVILVAAFLAKPLSYLASSTSRSS